MDRFKKAKKASILGIVGNIFLLVIKLIISIITHSQAMIADSVNSAADIFSSVMTYIGNKIASRPKDEGHNLGYGKAEYIFSMIISISMIVIAIKLLMDSIKTIFKPSEFDFSIGLIIVCIITIIIKLFLYLYTHKIAKAYNNLLIEANAKDHINDCFITTCTLIASALSSKGILIVDGIVGAGISAWILVTGIKIFLESYNVLMDKSISEESKNKVLDIIKTHPEIKKINHFNSTPVGYKYQISFTIFVDGNLSTFESHDIANKLEKEIDKKVEEIYLTVIHVNPM